ncbi:MAG: M3 family metallopeptidase [Propionibacteriales bacterium]|nr:M3 family metallopeptidase [Propionibacteriales bacterium]
MTTTISSTDPQQLAQLLAGRLHAETVHDPESFERHVLGRSNLAYLMLYLESNDVPAAQVAAVRAALDGTRQDRLRLAADLEALRLPGPLERVRGRWVEELHRAGGDPTRADVQAARERFDGALAALDASVDELVRRLGGPEGPVVGTGDSVVYAWLARFDDPQRRVKLSAARERVRSQQVPQAVDALEELVGLRTVEARERGFGSALEASLSASDLDVDRATDYVQALLREAVIDNASLRSELEAGLGERWLGRVGDHLPAYLRAEDTSTTVLLDAGRLVEHALEELTEPLPVDGVAVDRQTDTIRLLRGRSVLGTIALQAWVEHRPTTNVTLSQAELERPLAFVAVPPADGDGRRTLPLGAAQRLMHELGHALNHVLIEERGPSSTGLDYLPLERVDLFSTCLERWVYRLDLHESGVVRQGTHTDLQRAQRLRQVQARQAAAERAVVSALDLAIHGSSSPGVVAAYDVLVAEHGVDSIVSLDAVLPYFGWPSLLAHPGADLAVPYAAALAEVTMEGLLARRPGAGATLVEQALRPAARSTDSDPRRAVRPGAWIR